MNFTADKIDEKGLWLGDITASENIEALNEHGITHILTILDYQPKRIDPNRTYLHIHADDFHSTDLLTNEFEKCFQFLDNALEQGHHVLIHCHAGVSRSATITAMYLMRKYSLTREQALQRIINKRRYWSVLPNEGFLYQLDLFHQMNYIVDVNHELYRDFQKKIFERIPTDRTTVIRMNEVNEQREYHCRSCHEKLFNSNDVQKHEDSSKNLCQISTNIFTFYLDWIDEVFLNSLGTILCPKCRISLGEYSLQGIQCICQQWIKPAFVFHCQSIE